MNVGKAPPRVLEEQNIMPLGVHPLAENVQLVGAQGANVPADAL